MEERPTLNYARPKPRRRVDWKRFGWLVAAALVAAVFFYCASLGNLLG